MKKKVYLPPQIKGYSIEPYQFMTISGDWDSQDHEDLSNDFWTPRPISD